jgi:hypothetical protein
MEINALCRSKAVDMVHAIWRTAPILSRLMQFGNPSCRILNINAVITTELANWPKHFFRRREN